ncbi:DUF1405 domain-containing protein [Halapricum salinum]|uniref:DUF1405 domain-containing protein n=1 Tax=Halapricum salinum TaxID=1457250 RepID=A0A4D6HGA4_9EURY|nr:DUF1405 domain-containing protein [Halapricum salinum]QCC51817.1 DUF1405 domain-containing protein [Halapricum salinum]
MASGVGRRIERLVARYFDADLPASERLPRYVAPLPKWLEDIGLRLAWPIVLVNLVGTLFGFWYYAGQPTSIALEGQLGAAPLEAWVLIPDSPAATMFIGLSLAAWKLGWEADWLHALAFFGCIKLGLWTPYVQLALNGPEGIALWLYLFLIGSHLAMAVEAFLIHRYASFSVPAVAVAVAWYGFNDVVDYFWPILDGPHHTWLRAEPVVTTAAGRAYDHSVAAHDLAAACAVVLTILATFLALATRLEKVKVDRNV